VTNINIIPGERSILITVRGLVQGVGFRPFVYRIARENGLTGWVRNTNECVEIRVDGESGRVDSFLHSLEHDAPSVSVIESVNFRETDGLPPEGFSILKSDDVSDSVTEISPDIAVCNECLGDMDQEGSRNNYPFVNCTNCGPRFTIITDLPYDRRFTTMDRFKMCPACRDEYEDIADRRFHAQPIACGKCGPEYRMIIKGKEADFSITEIIDSASEMVDSGKLLAIKGLGGMHLACDAFNESAVLDLRRIKSREGKPFAVMFRDIESLKKYTLINEAEEKSLFSWRRPIVLLEKTEVADGSPGLPEAVNNGLSEIGVMLPYMPFHTLLFRKLRTPAIVLTSGNFSNEPIIIENDLAISRFGPVTDAVLVYNRDIQNRTDDSVVRIINGKERVFRRSRGYVPRPLRSPQNLDGIIAFGGELTNCFGVGKGGNAILSQHIGDLQGMETTGFYGETLERFLGLFRVKPSLLVADMHPDYYSGVFARDFKERFLQDKGIDLPLIMVQHHHAHIASCMAEYSLDEKVIGVAFDGTGYGIDGNIWGAEFFVCDFADFERISHFEYLPLPGGDRAVEEPWRMGVSALYKVYGGDLTGRGLKIDPEKVSGLIKMLEKNINCPLVSSAGRMFDAIAAILDLCLVATFPAEGPMRLESCAAKGIAAMYSYSTGDIISFDETIREIVDDHLKGVHRNIIAAKFHNTMTAIISDTVKEIRNRSGLNKVVLSGGVFQNKYLLSAVEKQLGKDNFEVYSHCRIPSNDGGIALGQMLIAAKRRELKCV
jgi:hydrogenase maturation protein HypF